jgi:hypothetical protein
MEINNGNLNNSMLLFQNTAIILMKKYNGFYAGAHIGGLYLISKWNYLNTDNI